MIRKTKLSAVILGLAALAGADFAAACSTAQWGAGSPPGGGTIGATAGSPATSNGQSFRRYAGACGLRAQAAGQIVQDGTPATAESRYIASFYVNANAGANTNVFTMMADEITDYAIVTVRHTGTGFVFVNRNGTASSEITAAPGKWYQVHLDWSRAASTLDVTVKGNAGATNTASPVQLTGFTLADPGDGPDYVQLGWVSGGTTGTVNVDAFESRRATAIAKLCRGDANNSFVTSNGTTGITVGDAVTISNEATTLGAANPTYGAGQTDCNEDGSISVSDAICVSNRAFIANVCTNQP